MKALISSGGDKSHKISEQLLLFGIIQIRSRCHYYDVNLTPKVCLALKKCGHTSQWFLLGVNLLYDIYNVPVPLYQLACECSGSSEERERSMNQKVETMDVT